jgi:hypothetical protein
VGRVGVVDHGEIAGGVTLEDGEGFGRGRGHRGIVCGRGISGAV